MNVVPILYVLIVIYDKRRSPVACVFTIRWLTEAVAAECRGFLFSILYNWYRVYSLY